jgi:hypothetical protein
MYNSDPTPQGVENRNILLWFKCVLKIEWNSVVIKDRERDVNMNECQGIF